jgi:hypothetical protein
VRLTYLRRTTGFRLATLFLAMFGVVSVLLFGYLYIEITGFEMERVDDWLMREHTEIVREAPADLAVRIERQSLHDPRFERPFALFDANGKHRAGGYQGDFSAVPYFNRPFSMRLTLNDKHPPGRCVLSSCRLYTDCHRARKQVSSRLIPELLHDPDFDSSLELTMRHRKVCLRSSSQHVPDVLMTPFPQSLTTTSFGRSRTGRFDICSCKPISGGQLPSLVQHRRLTPAFVTH